MRAARKAFYRLAERLKQRFPRLPLCLALDGLFAGGPTFSRCEQYGWKYLIVLQEKDMATVHQEFEALAKLVPENHLCFHTGPQASIRQDYRWVNEILASVFVSATSGFGAQPAELV